VPLLGPNLPEFKKRIGLPLKIPQPPLGFPKNGKKKLKVSNPIPNLQISKKKAPLNGKIQTWVKKIPSNLKLN